MRGRPRKPPEEVLHPVTIRLTQAEAEAVDRAALKHRVPTSVVLRQIIRRALFRTQ